MNVDEAMEVITGAEPSCLEHLAGAVLVAEVERLRAELANLQKRYDEEIGSYEDEDPRSMGWVGCDGLP